MPSPQQKKAKTKTNVAVQEPHVTTQHSPAESKLPSRRTSAQETSEGVHWHTKDQQWHARVRVGAKRKYLGSFATKQEACAAVDAANHLQQSRTASDNNDNDTSNDNTAGSSGDVAAVLEGDAGDGADSDPAVPDGADANQPGKRHSNADSLDSDVEPEILYATRTTPARSTHQPQGALTPAAVDPIRTPTQNSGGEPQAHQNSARSSAATVHVHGKLLPLAACSDVPTCCLRQDMG